MKKFFILTLFSFVALAPVAFADTTSTVASSSSSSAGSTTIAVPSESCSPNSASFAQIQAIQNDPALGGLDEVKAELALRKQLLSQTIVCAKNEEQLLRTSLANTTVDPSFQNLQTQLVGQLDEAGNYYDLQLAKVNGVGIAGTEAIAKDVLAWRESNYAPLAANVSNFLLWSQNQVLFTAADNRLAQVSGLTQSVPFSQNAALQSDFQAATVSLEAAVNDNVQAREALAKSLPSGESLSMIEQSLDALSSTYQHFFDISNLVQTLLPH